MVTIKVPFFRRADFLIPIAIATALIISVSVASAVDLERGLVAYYSFDDCSAKDLSGNGNDDIIYGAKCVNGKFGKALRFDGVDDYVEVSDNPMFSSHATVGEITVVAWVKVLGLSTDTHRQMRQPVIAKGFPGEWEWALYVYDDQTVGFSTWQCGGSGHSEPYGGFISLNEWHHLAASFKEGVANRVYLNGVEVATGTTFKGRPCDGTRPVRIGSREDGQFLNAIIDEVRIYNRALSEEEIRALYEQGVTPRPKLAIETDIDTSLKQGEVRKGTIRVENTGNSDAKSVKVRLFSEGLGIDVEKSYAKIPSGEAREFLFEVSANEAGTFKLSAYAEYWDDKGNKYVETADKFVHVEAVVLPTSQPTSQAPKTPEARETARPAEFYAFFASLLMAASYFLIRLKGKKN